MNGFTKDSYPKDGGMRHSFPSRDRVIYKVEASSSQSVSVRNHVSNRAGSF